MTAKQKQDPSQEPLSGTEAAAEAAPVPTRKGDAPEALDAAVAAVADTKPGSDGEREAIAQRLAVEQAALGKGVRPEDARSDLAPSVDPLAGYEAPAKVEDGEEWLAPVDDRGRSLVDHKTGEPLAQQG